MKKEWLKSTTTLLLAGILTVSAFSAVNAQEDCNRFKVGEKVSISQLQMADNAYVIDYKSADVTGDKVNDHVVLAGNKLYSRDDIFADNLTVVVQDGKSKKYSKATYENFCGYDGNLFIGDFTGDKVNDVMVSAATGGSGGIVSHLIATFNNNEPTVIFNEENNNGINITGKYLDGFKAELNVENINKDITLDLSANKDSYVEYQTYDTNGTLLEGISPWIDPFSLLEAVDYNGDGVYELRGYQSVSGTCHADRITCFESLWQYDNNSWNIEQLEYSTYLVK